MTTIVLSAGGTGGHLFPAQALASELARRGRRVVVMTDGAGTNHGGISRSGRSRYSGRTFADSLATRLFAPLKIIAGILVSFAKLWKIRPAAVVGFGGYQAFRS